ncbi:hypothetical protein AB1K91_07090 [Terribacillus sp. 179-K 1B1 HS]|uniref:hypothetical protein n=1 Tax=Terribacillus sp. 179-K 1B1 HS TaxID=3142388 RepID=UPI0039A363B7
MGVVKRNAHKHEQSLRFLTLSDIEVIEGLIRNRSEFDEHYDIDPSKQIDIERISNIAISLAEELLNKKRKEEFLEKGQNGKMSIDKEFKAIRLLVHRDKRSALEKLILPVSPTPLNPEVIAIYADLDFYIASANLTPKQENVIALLQYGLKEPDIGLLYNQKTQAITKNLKTACNKIKAEYDKHRKYALANQNYITASWDYSICPKCKKQLPLTTDFFYKEPRGKKGYQSKCKICVDSKRNG